MATVSPPIVTLAGIAALALLCVIWWLWWRLPKRQVAQLALKIRDPKARADVEDSFRKTIGQALGSVAVLIGAGVAYLQFTQQQRASHDLLIKTGAIPTARTWRGCSASRSRVERELVWAQLLGRIAR